MSAALDSVLAATDVTRERLVIAETVASDLEITAIERDRLGGTPKRERDALCAIWPLKRIVPAKRGGAGATWTVALRAVRTIAGADGSLGHAFGFQHLLLATARLYGTRAQLESLARARVAERATTARLGFDRFWRNLRTHTLHDPVDYKRRGLGRWFLTDAWPTPSFYS
jgi:alkylation response protein AidB-like acyl-CoA dehydrogenase